VTRDIVRMFYLPCDVLVMPTHDDTFGMTILHALSCATPVVTTEQFAAPELIERGKNGLFVHSDRLHLEQVSSPNRETTKKYHRRQRAEQVLVDDLVSKIGFLYLNRDAVRDMGRRAVDDFAPGGKFSVEVRNRSLARAYLHSLADSRQPLSSPKGA
jgi:glycosyltransferase involved in cell wall biosynthesis